MIREQYLDSLGVDDKLEQMMITQIYRVTASDSKSVGQYFAKNASILMFFLMPIFALLLNLFFILVIVGFLYFSNEKRSKYYASFWVESIPIFWWLAQKLLTYF